MQYGMSNRKVAADLSEAKTGVRMCTSCDALLPLSEFGKGKRMYMCAKHFKEVRRRYSLGSLPKVAFNSLRCRAYQDTKRLFKQPHMSITKKYILSLLNEEQLENFTNYHLIPLYPEDILSSYNSILVTTKQRHYVFAGWKETRDPARYKKDLSHVLSTTTE
jgi:hypothetical protein